MNKYGWFLPLLIMVSLLSSCLEITQYAGMDKNGLIVDTRISVQKALFQMAQSAGEETSESLLDDINLEALRSAIPSKHLLAAEKFDTELEMGISLRVQYDPQGFPDWNATDIPIFFPRMDGKTLIVEIQGLKSSSATGGNDVAAAIMSGFKYRLFIARSLIVAPKTAFLVLGQEKVPVTLISYPEFSVIEISMAYIMSAPGLIKLIVE